MKKQLNKTLISSPLPNDSNGITGWINDVKYSTANFF